MKSGDLGKSTWYTKELGDGITASIPSDEVKEAFSRVFHAEGTPIDMAVFTRLESEGRLHCEVIAYFSPSASDVAKAFDAQPCERPARMGLDLLAGDKRAWSVLFADSD